jgi:site-specific recombinase XerD
VFGKTFVRARNLTLGRHEHQVVPHCLRHTYATRLTQRGLQLGSLSHMLGHSGVQITMRYAHHSPEAVEGARALLEGR